jgi:hypothetical protein
LNNRLRFLLILIGALLVAVTFTFPQWRPFFVNQIVAERFPGLSAEQQIAFLALPTEQQGAFDELLATADSTMVIGLARGAIQPDVAVPTEQQAMPELTDPTVVELGTFTEIDPIHRGSGSATIYQLPDNSRVLRFEEFRVTNGQQLHVILTRNADPRTAAEVGTDYIDLGLLKGNVGDQNYNVPSEVDFSLYQGVVIYSLPFQVVFTTAPLA